LRLERRLLLGKAAGQLMLAGGNPGAAFLDALFRLAGCGRYGSCRFQPY